MFSSIYLAGKRAHKVAVGVKASASLSAKDFWL